MLYIGFMDIFLENKREKAWNVKLPMTITFAKKKKKTGGNEIGKWWA